MVPIFILTSTSIHGIYIFSFACKLYISRFIGPTSVINQLPESASVNNVNKWNGPEKQIDLANYDYVTIQR